MSPSIFSDIQFFTEIFCAELCQGLTLPRVMKKLLILTCSVVVSVYFSEVVRAQSDAPYIEGPVWDITMVKTKYGMTDDYLKAIAKTFKGASEEAKKEGLIVDYKILLGAASSAQDYNILLMTAYKNMAALDNAREKFDPIGRKLEGAPDQQRDAAVKRGEFREILGDKLMREITLK
jgi:hypothetical protein